MAPTGLTRWAVPTADDVLVAVTGAATAAPAGTTLPGTASAGLDAAFQAVGYISADGITQAFDADNQRIRDWATGATVATIRTRQKLTFQFSMLETSSETLDVFFGNFSASAAQVTSARLPALSWVFDMLDGDTHIRIVVPEGWVTERGDVAFVGGDAVAYPVTIVATPDASGVNAYLHYAEDAEPEPEPEPAAMTWDDDTAMTWDDDAEMEWA